MKLPRLAASDYYQSTAATDLDAEMSAVKASGLGVLTVAQAVTELTPQIVK